MSLYVMCESNQKVRIKVKNSKMKKTGESRRLNDVLEVENQRLNGGTNRRTDYDTFDGIEVIREEEVTNFFR
jgi:hypothetical protein